MQEAFYNKLFIDHQNLHFMTGKQAKKTTTNHESILILRFSVILLEFALIRAEEDEQQGTSEHRTKPRTNKAFNAHAMVLLNCKTSSGLVLLKADKRQMLGADHCLHDLFSV